jgi:ABC-type oligopeptide transport system ATPase subunit
MRRGCNRVSFEQVLKRINAELGSRLGRSLREPEIVILRGTWQGWTYEQMAAASEYSVNYLMRDIAPKLWKRLSKAWGQQIGKTNFKAYFEQLLLASRRCNELHTRPARLAESRTASHVEGRGDATDFGWQNPPSTTLSLSNKYAWNPSVSPNQYYGYDTELNQLQQWLVEQQCNIVSVLGPSGIGKTTLIKLFLEVNYQQLGYVIWRSLKSAPTLSELLQTFLYDFLDAYSPSNLSSDQLIEEARTVFQRQPITLILDDVEAILKPGTLPGTLREGYENYGEFLGLLALEPHPSRLLLTGLEVPAEIRLLAAESSVTEQLLLTGLSHEAGCTLLEAEGLKGLESWPQLIDYYQGHPHALKIVARIINELMDGNTTEFITQGSFLLREIKTHLEATFSRLSPMEKEMLDWLAVKAEPVSLSALRGDIPPQLNTQDTLVILDALKQRSLLNILQRDGQSWFTLKPMIADYVTSRFIAQFREHDAASNFTIGHLSPPQGGSIRLTAAKPAPVNLSPWFQNHFQSGWQTLDQLFEGSATPAWRFRSTFSLRDGRVIKRFKHIPFDQAKARHVALVVAISREGDQSIRISVQAQPVNINELLPVSLALKLLDVDANVLASVETQQEDLFIQLPDFYGEPGEQFNIQLLNAYANHTEAFVL